MHLSSKRQSAHSHGTSIAALGCGDGVFSADLIVIAVAIRAVAVVGLTDHGHDAKRTALLRYAVLRGTGRKRIECWKAVKQR